MSAAQTASETTENPAEPSWLAPAFLLTAVTLAASAALYLAAGGQEPADDAARLLRLTRQPFVLWGDYKAAGLSNQWGSFPPLFPPMFAILVIPWTWVTNDFWAIRLGALSWSIVGLVALHLTLGRVERAPRNLHRVALWFYATLPSVWGTAALNPQEESYVSLHVIALYALARTGRWAWIPTMLVFTALSGKYVLLVLVIPLALSSRSPLRNGMLYSGVGVAAVAAYVGYHHVVHGLNPILSYSLDSEAAISIWGLLWHLDFSLAPSVQTPLSVALCLAVVGVFGFVFRHRMPLAFLLTSSLLLTLIGLSIAVPGYLHWIVPVALICFVRTKTPGQRTAVVALLFGWGIGEWTANLARGVLHSLETNEGAKAAVVERVLAVVGPDFPLQTVHITSLVVVVGTGLALVAVLAAAGRNADSESGHTS